MLNDPRVKKIIEEELNATELVPFEEYMLTMDQFTATERLLKWWFADTKAKQTFTIAGYAGTGKSFIIGIFKKKLKLSERNIAFITYTGAASMVLRDRGNKSAMTIHSLIYKLAEVKDEETGNQKLIFVLRTKEEPPASLKVIIVDEVSMVSKKMMADIKSLGLPIITLGDQMQLDPVEGEMNDEIKNPDVTLTRIVRTALDNEITLLSLLIRRDFEFKRYIGKDVFILPMDELPDEVFMNASQILCYTNATRRLLNKTIRGMKGFTSPLPEVGDKMICTKNNWEVEPDELNSDYSLVNGLIGYITEPISVNKKKKLYHLDLKCLYSSVFSFSGVLFNPNLIDPPLVEGENFKYPVPDKNDFKNQLVYNEFDYGYCITVHKSQGSQFDKVLYIDEKKKCRNKELLKRLRYVACTRAVEKIIIGI